MSDPLRPPAAPRRPHVHRHHGVERPDPYHWLQGAEGPEVDAHLQAENAYVEARTAHLEGFRRTLYDEFMARIHEGEQTAAVPDGPWAYYRRREAGKPYWIHCRRPTTGGEEQVLLDANELAAGHEFYAVRTVAHSPDHRILAFAADTTGQEKYEIRFLDLESGELLPDRIVDATASLTWATDSRTLMWIAQNEAQRAFRVHRHRLGDPGPDPVVFEEADERFFVRCFLISSRAFLVIGACSWDSSEYHLIPADDPAAPPRCVQPRRAKLHYLPVHAADALWIVTDHEAPSGRVMRAPVASTSMTDWRDVVAPRPEVTIEDLHAQAGALVITEREAGQLRIRVRDLATEHEHLVEFPDEICMVGVAENLEFELPAVRLSYVSMASPPSVYRYDLDARTLELVHQEPVPGHDPSQYRTWRSWTVAPDGARVPISLVHRADLEPGPTTPLVVFGYGAYGRPVDPNFMPPWLTLLERGGVLAIAHVRGGGMLGREWYEAGRLQHKQNSITDFVAVVRGLHELGIGSPATTGLHGMSAGGILVGGAANQAPEICTAILASVPFVTVLDAMLDPDLPLTTTEYEQFGDPRDEQAFRCMLAWSPYDNVVEQDYPDIFVTSGRTDPRVPFWGPTKWVARLRERATSGDFLLRTFEAGHRGRSGLHAALWERALSQAWLLDRLGLSS